MSRSTTDSTSRLVAETTASFAATMHQISAEAGYANGALKTYFAGKADLLEATYTHVFERTNERVERAAAGLSGLGALVAFCGEVMPLDEERLDEARVVMAFWQEAAHDPARAAHNNRYMHRWRASHVPYWDALAPPASRPPRRPRRRATAREPLPAPGRPGRARVRGRPAAQDLLPLPPAQPVGGLR
ncbi:TetR family transcriptional regulator C-terminal domain-containing protein [Kocuria marina]|uniref:TetR family transcriptional regulator C-terminal domain-containing protein n=1 Tax=Kocuria marina TaxID=223184 RepID=UPI0022DF6548|nr:TetR family transcriptional regulator C-terminal domain-containing protein [Kocuria marina]